MINAFLQMLDGFRGPSLLVAATNHEHLLDAALWRRFDEVVRFPLPTVQALRRLVRLRLPAAAREGIDIESCASALRGLPPAAVERAVWNARREALLDGRERVGQRELQAAIARVRARPW